MEKEATVAVRLRIPVSLHAKLMQLKYASKANGTSKGKKLEDVIVEKITAGLDKNGRSK